MRDRSGEDGIRRLQRIRQGEAPVTLDLFAGCGGLSLGFETAGFRVSGAIEKDRLAAATYSANFDSSGDRLGVLVEDIGKIELHELVEKIPRLEQGVDVIIAGPPCQAFARIGRAKLREIREHPEAWHLDERASLYEQFLRIVALMNPLAVLLENVPDILTFRGRDVPGVMASELGGLGYNVSYSLLNAAHYGVPQTRERFFLIGFRHELGIDPVFPSPLRNHVLPSGYREIRAQLRPEAMLESSNVFTPPIDPGTDLPQAIRAGEALRDLPKIKDHLDGRLLPGMKHQNSIRAYSRTAPSGYGRLMRAWPGLAFSRGVTAHAIRVTPRDFEIFRRMCSLDQYPRALEIAEGIFEAKLSSLKSTGRAPEEGSSEWEQLLQSLVPPYDPEKFPGKWQKLDAQRPSHTITAHLGRDCYSHIHPDSDQARTISVREAARLQSFPDSFSFPCALNPSFKQIGNAVPPLLAFAVASCIRAALRGEDDPATAVRDLVVEASTPRQKKLLLDRCSGEAPVAEGAQVCQELWNLRRHRPWPRP